MTSRREIVTALIRQQMGEGTAFRFRVTSGSMAPLIEVGDSVTVQQISLDELRRGDVVVYEDGGTFRVHRLLSIHGELSERLLVTRGDGVFHKDRAWSEGALMGKVVAVEKDGREVDLDTPVWRMTNQLLGLVSWVEMLSLELARRLKRATVGDQKLPLTRWGISLLHGPLRLCTKLAAIVWTRQIASRAGKERSLQSNEPP